MFEDVHIKPLFYVVDTDNPPLLGLSLYRMISVTILPRMRHLTSCLNLRMSLPILVCFQGNIYKIHLKPDAVPVVHSSRMVPVALREPLKSELKRIADSDTIAKVDIHTDRVNSLVVAQKRKAGKLRVCLDPQALSKAIRRPHYPVRTLDDILPHLTGAKFLSILDARGDY